MSALHSEDLIKQGRGFFVIVEILNLPLRFSNQLSERRVITISYFLKPFVVLKILLGMFFMYVFSLASKWVNRRDNIASVSMSWNVLFLFSLRNK